LNLVIGDFLWLSVDAVATSCNFRFASAVHQGASIRLVWLTMMDDIDTPYGDYLGLRRLLSTQAPRSDGAAALDEHFFIVAHQACELWAKHLLLDCAAAIRCMRSSPNDFVEVRHLLVRMTSIVELMTAHTEVLMRMSRQQFASFRPLLGTASGVQSIQLRRWFSYLGLPQGESELFDAYLGVLTRRGLQLQEVCGRSDEMGILSDIADRLSEVSEAVWGWQLVHIKVVRHMLGDAVGTGGTAGAEFLTRRAALPFPALWEAKGSRHPMDLPTGRPDRCSTSPLYQRRRDQPWL
jgi:tryptophan 2,3-dioxygenase